MEGSPEKFSVLKHLFTSGNLGSFEAEDNPEGVTNIKEGEELKSEGGAVRKVGQSETHYSTPYEGSFTRSGTAYGSRTPSIPSRAATPEVSDPVHIGEELARSVLENPWFGDPQIPPLGNYRAETQIHVSRKEQDLQLTHSDTF